MYGKEEAQDLPRIEVLGNVDRAGLRHADAVRVRAPDRQRADAIAHAQPRAARAELLDDADELVAGRERRLRGAREVRAGAQLGIGERHPGRQNLDEHLARTRSRILLLDHLSGPRARRSDRRRRASSQPSFLGAVMGSPPR